MSCPVNVKLPLFLTEHHTMKSYGGVEIYLHAFLTSALDGGEWSSSDPYRFTPRKKIPLYPLDKKLVCPP
jgi:hypothetical protein